MIPFRQKTKKNKIEYFAPFFIEIKDQSNINNLFSRKKKTYTKNLRRLLIAYKNIKDIAKNKIDSKKQIDACGEDTFGFSTFGINISLFEKPFEILDEEFLEKLKNRISKRDKSLYLETYEDFELVFDCFFDLLLESREGKFEDISAKVKEFIRTIDEHLQNVIENSMKIELVLKEDSSGEKEIDFDKFVFHSFFVVNTEVLEDKEKFNTNIIKLYQQIIDDQSISEENLLYKFFTTSPLLEKFSANIDEVKKREREYGKFRFLELKIPERLKLNKKQLGAFDPEFSLTKSQRYCLQIAKSGLDVIPVSGPPGTGKTSLLRAFIADYTIENALHIIDQISSVGTTANDFSSISFYPPIAAFSTNNQAQKNIIDGVTEGFLAFKEKGDFYTRWLNPNIKEKKENISIVDYKLYVPMLKSTINKEEKHFTISFLEDLLNSIESDVQNYTKDFLQYAKNCFTDLILDIENSNHERLLIKVFRHLSNEIEKDIKDIKSLLSENTDNKLDFFYKNRENLLKIAKLINDTYLISEIDTDVKSTEEMSNIIENKIVNIINKAKEEIEKYNIFRQNAKQKQEEISAKYNLQEQKKIVAITTKYQNKAKAEIAKSKEKISEIKKNLKIIKELELIELNEKLDKNRNSQKNVVLKILDLLSHTLKKEEESILKEISEKKKRVLELDFEKNEIETKMTEAEKIYKNQIETEIELFRKDFQKELEKEIKLLEKTIESSSKDLREKLFDLEFNSADDAKEAIKIFSSLKENYIGSDNILNEAEKINEEYKLDKKRSKLFFKAIHLLEAALLLKYYNTDNLETLVCPVCKTGGLRKNQEGNTLFHPDCKFRLSLRKQFRDKKRADMPLTDKEVVQILKHKTFIYDYLTFELQENPYKDNIWYNVKETFNSNKYSSLSKLSDISVLFPLLNTTSQSFFGIFSQYSEAKKKKVLPEGYFKYLLIDEAGMVLPSLMVNLYAGKKALLFGDTKQIEPVYPFGGNETLDKIIMSNVIPNDIVLRDKLLEKFSLLENNAMSIANKSIYIDDKNAIRADNSALLWLLQHFRCARPIIEYCNTLVYNGKIEAKTSAEEGYSHLRFIEHDYNMNLGQNTNADEAKIVLEQIKYFTEKENIDIKDIGVITPYRNQANLIIKILQNANIDTKELYVGTVHKFQGSERKVIIFSTSSGKDYDSDSRYLFMNRDSGNMLNVAVSRAKKCFVLVGCRSAIANNPASHSGKLVDHIDTQRIE